MDTYKQQRVFRRLRESNDKRVAILGSGLAAFIAHKLIPDSVIITVKRTPLFLHNVFLHDTVETRLFLKILGVKDLKRVQVPFYYYDHRKGSIEHMISEDDRQLMIREKMQGLLGGDIQDMSISTKKDLEDDFNVLTFNHDEFASRLYRESEIVELPITSVIENFSNATIEFGENLRCNFDYVLNTIPQNHFCKIHVNTKVSLTELKSIPVSFATVDRPMKSILDPDYMVYGFGDSPWKRVLTKNYKASIEYNTDLLVIDQVMQDFPDIEKATDVSIHTVPYGRIISKEIPDSRIVYNIGRFAEWQHRISTEHVINKIINLNL